MGNDADGAIFRDQRTRRLDDQRGIGIGNAVGALVEHAAGQAGAGGDGQPDRPAVFIGSDA